MRLGACSRVGLLHVLSFQGCHLRRVKDCVHLTCQWLGICHASVFAVLGLTLFCGSLHLPFSCFNVAHKLQVQKTKIVRVMLPSRSCLYTISSLSPFKIELCNVEFSVNVPDNRLGQEYFILALSVPKVSDKPCGSVDPMFMGKSFIKKMVRTALSPCQITQTCTCLPFWA